MRNRRSSRCYLADSLESRRLLAAIASDQTVTGSISAVAEVDEYTFNASAGEAIYATLAETTATGYDPAIELRAPNGAVITSDFSTYDGASGIGADIYAGNLTQTGTYTLRVTDSGNNETGNYVLTMAKLPGTQSPTDGEGGAISSGQKKNGTIGLGDLDVYTFSANASEPVILTTVEPTTSTLDPYTLVFGPTGALVASDYTEYEGASGVGNDISFTPATTGTYYVVIVDRTSQASDGTDYDFESGAYALRMVKLPGAQLQDDADGGAITSGQRKDGTIDLGDMDVYTFSANANDSVILTTAEPTASDYDPYTLVYGPTGAFVISDYSAYDGASGIGNDIFFKPAVSGTYYVVVMDVTDQASDGNDYGFQAGAYALRMVKTPGAQGQDDANGGAITSGQRKDGRIDSGDMDVYTFTANANDPVILTTVEPYATPFDPYTLVYGPTGLLVASDYTAYDDASGIGNDLFFNAPTSGTYYVVVMDLTDQASDGNDYGFDAGDYSLRMMKLPGLPAQDDADGGALTSGVTRNGVLDVGDLDAYSIAADAGDAIFAVASNLTEADGYDTRALLYSPTGVLVDSSDGAGEFAVAISNAVGGTYVLVILDGTTQASDGNDYDLERGEYILTAIVAPGAQPNSGDSGPIVAGTPRQGSISRGDADVYTFPVNAGTGFTLNLTETTTSGFDPSMWILGPSGVTLYSQQGSASLNASIPNPTASGTYTVIVYDAGGNESGAYALALGGTAPPADTLAPTLVNAEYRYNESQPDLRVRFSEDIGASFQFTDVQIIDLATNTPVPDFGLSTTYDATGDLFLVSFPGFDGRVLPDGRYRLSIPQAALTDAAGNPLAANIAFDFHVLAGDADRDRDVDFDDLLTLARNYGKIGLTFSQGNFDYSTNGEVVFDDLLMLARNYGKSLPLPSSATLIDSVKRTRARAADGVLA